MDEDSSQQRLLEEIRDLLREHTAKADAHLQQVFKRQNTTIIASVLALVLVSIPIFVFFSQLQEGRRKLDVLAEQELKQRIELNRRDLENTKQ